jgi:hypothetical protein
MLEVAARVLTARINLASIALTTPCRYPTFASLGASSIASLLSGDDGAEAVADENAPFRTSQELARQVGTVRGSFRLIEAGTSLEDEQP